MPYIVYASRQGHKIIQLCSIGFKISSRPSTFLWPASTRSCNISSQFNLLEKQVSSSLISHLPKGHKDTTSTPQFGNVYSVKTQYTQLHNPKINTNRNRNLIMQEKRFFLEKEEKRFFGNGPTYDRRKMRLSLLSSYTGIGDFITKQDNQAHWEKTRQLDIVPVPT